MCDKKAIALESHIVEQQGQLRTKLLDCQKKLSLISPIKRTPLRDALLRLTYEYTCPALVEPMMIIITIKQSEENTNRQNDLVSGCIANMCEHYCTNFNQGNGCSNSLSS
jgi:hypothetical protein